MTQEKTVSQSRALDIAYIGIGAALITICSWISIPTAVPFSMQTFAVFFMISALGAKRGTCSVLVYILLGAAGMPVFTKFGAGIGVLLGNTGGYILGFLLIGIVSMLMTKLCGKKLWAEVTAMLIGLVLCYAFGTAWFLYLYTRTKGAVSLGTVLGWCVFPFIIPDLLKLGLALLLAHRIAPRLHHAHAS